MVATVIPVVIYWSVSTGEADRVQNPSFSYLSPSLMNLLAAMFSFGQLPFLLFLRESTSLIFHLPYFFSIQWNLFFQMVVSQHLGVWCR